MVYNYEVEDQVSWHHHKPSSPYTFYAILICFIMVISNDLNSFHESLVFVRFIIIAKPSVLCTRRYCCHKTRIVDLGHVFSQTQRHLQKLYLKVVIYLHALLLN